MKQKKPPIPEKMELLSLGEPNYTRHQWFAYIQDRIRAFKKALRMKGSDQRIGMSEPMIKRRTEALLDSMPYIEKRYGALPGLQPSVSNSLGKAWVHMNILASSTYNALASDFYLLYAAALWILDQLEDVPGAYWTIQKYLPKDEEALAELDWPPFWDASYDIRLIQSVEYALENRNTDIAPLEIDATQNRRVFNSDLTAKGKHHEDVESRRNFESILNLIPQERIDTAVEHFQKLFIRWLDQYFQCISVMEAKKEKCMEKANTIAEEYNRYREEVIALVNTPVKKEKPAKTVLSPLVMSPQVQKAPLLSPEEMLKSLSLQNNGLFPGPAAPGAPVPASRLTSLFYTTERNDSPPSRLIDIAHKMEQAVDRNAEATDELDAIVDQISAFTFSMSREGMMTKEYCAKECGEDVASLLQELEISDPYELCFALLYLFDDPQRRAAPCTEDRIDVFELPWLYGAGTSFMQLVTQALPWTFEEYEEEYDPVWSPDDEDEEQLSFLQTKNTAPSSQKPILPNFYERRFLSDDDIKRNLAQLIYEETGCVPPRNMEKYAGIVKELRGKGARAKDLPVLLSLITLSGYAQRQHQALNLDQDPLTEKLLSEDKGDQGNTDSNAPNQSASKKDRTKEELLDQVEDLQEQAAQYQELNKRLRTAVHDLEQKTRRIEKVLNDTNAAAEMERRELADLRELIFNKENGAEEETEEEIQDAAFPYEVQQDTLIFGGHQTWLRAIRQLLKGNIRFIDKDLNFDVGIVRHADRIWIQTNALSHTQYYRIVDTARTFHKPVRYFAYASALKCARQVAESDTE